MSRRGRRGGRYQETCGMGGDKEGRMKGLL